MKVSGSGPVLRKILVTLVTGAISFPFTQLLFTNLAGQIAAAASFGAIVLVVQLLVDFERRLAGVENGLLECVEDIRRMVDQGFAKVNHATSLIAQVESGGLRQGEMTLLIERAAKISPTAPALVRSFVQTEVDRVSTLLHDLANGEATYAGEDQEWLLNLTICAEASIDAVSIPEVDAAGVTYHSFWKSPLGRRYMGLQRRATQRGVRVRRLFVTGQDAGGETLELREICELQTSNGIEVRVLYLSAIPEELRSHIFDFILFDDQMSYESTPGQSALYLGNGPSVLSTRLEFREARVAERVALYESIWAVATPWPEIAANAQVLSAVPEEP